MSNGFEHRLGAFPGRLMYTTNVITGKYATSMRFPQLLFGWLRSLVAHVKFDVAVVKVDSLQLR